jgi:hypothetical protein
VQSGNDKSALKERNLERMPSIAEHLGGGGGEVAESEGEFQKSLVAAITKEPDHGFSKSDKDKVDIPEDFFNDIVFFRDYAMPEMTKVLRGDKLKACNTLTN